MLAMGQNLAGVRLEDDQLVKLQGVNRQLQAAIDALRAELERQAAAIAEAVQASEARWADEVAQLRATIHSVRDEMDTQVAEGHAQIQAMRAAAEAEAAHLQIGRAHV